MINPLDFAWDHPYVFRGKSPVQAKYNITGQVAGTTNEIPTVTNRIKKMIKKHNPELEIIKMTLTESEDDGLLDLYAVVRVRINRTNSA